MSRGSAALLLSSKPLAWATCACKLFGSAAGSECDELSFLLSGATPDDLVRNRWLPILGSGFSRNADVPSRRTMPLWDDLGKVLHQELPDHVYTNPLDIISTYSHAYSRSKLIEKLYDVLLIDEARPREVRKAFCSLPFDIVCTTNFDFLLERQYTTTQRPYTPVVGEQQLSITVGSTLERTAPRTSLLKIHGDVNHPADLIVTEDDYDDFVPSHPLLSTFIGNLLITRTAVLVGYSLDDPDLRQIWRIVGSRLGRLQRPAYAISVDADVASTSRYERRGIKVINLPGSKSQYSGILRAAFDELREYWAKGMISESVAVRDEPVQDALSPKDDSARICFFACPQSVFPFFNEVLSSEIARAGFVPMAAQDVVSPGDNVTAKIEAMIARASIAIIVSGSEWTNYEHRLAQLRLGTERVLLLTRDSSEPTLESPSLGREIVVSPAVFDDPSWLVSEVRAWLDRQSATIGRHLEEPARLLAKGEYRAALIAAVTAIEIELRSRLLHEEYEIDPRASLMRLIMAAERRGIILSDTVRELEEIVRARNSAAHTKSEVTQQQAQHAVGLVQQVFVKRPPMPGKPRRSRTRRRK